MQSQYHHRFVLASRGQTKSVWVAMLYEDGPNLRHVAKRTTGIKSVIEVGARWIAQIHKTGAHKESDRSKSRASRSYGG